MWAQEPLKEEEGGRRVSVEGRLDDETKGQRDSTLLALKVGELGHEPGTQRLLEAEKGQQTDSSLEPPKREPAQVTPGFQSRGTRAGLLIYRPVR